MSQITRCPACETLFKVVPDQLRISEGWVRCGECDEVFDAAFHLLQAASEPAMPAPPQEPVAEIAEIPSDRHREAAESFVIARSEATRQSMPEHHDSGLPSWPSLRGAQRRGNRNDETGMFEVSISLSDASSPIPIPDAGLRATEPEDHASLSDFSFLRKKEERSFWSQPLTRATLFLLSVALLLGLAGQIALHERDRLATLHPSLKPGLLALCEPLSCTVSPLRKIESIVIDSSSFARIRGDAYRLNFTLKNTADSALAVPAIELTVTDSLDQVLVRRVFLPAELGVKSDTLAAGFEWPASQAVALNAGVGADRVVGYRLLAFYP